MKIFFSKWGGVTHLIKKVSKRYKNETKNKNFHFAKMNSDFDFSQYFLPPPPPQPEVVQSLDGYTIFGNPPPPPPPKQSKRKRQAPQQAEEDSKKVILKSFIIIYS